MKNKIKHKFGFPDWLKELISKGKYQIGSLNTIDNDEYISITNGEINKQKINSGEVKKENLNNIASKLVNTKIINSRKYHFDTQRKVIIIENDND